MQSIVVAYFRRKYAGVFDTALISFAGVAELAAWRASAPGG